ncbi:hypothetical protein H5410_051287 [Solanum commersonii]|uniref:Uncharacterized protein n=1 Tax=Solanum commersonii TaxID=4109 RepID=A0A9J5X037_SOLCO|nr:hypothetical protein H5410_051287 [Solanum commersonii]
MPSVVPLATVLRVAIVVDAEDEDDRDDKELAKERSMRSFFKMHCRDLAHVKSSGVTPDSTTILVAETGINSPVLPPMLPLVILLASIDAPLRRLHTRLQMRVLHRHSLLEGPFLHPLSILFVLH